MARIRTIKPEFWEDEKIANLPIPCRLFFIGIWNFADDYGVFRGNPSILKAKIFPYDNLNTSDVQEWINILENARMIIPVNHNDESYYLIRTFNSHQIIDKRYQKSILPQHILNEAIKQITMCSHSSDIVPTPQEEEKEEEMELEEEEEMEGSEIGEKNSPTNSNENKKEILKKRYFKLVQEVQELYPTPTQFEKDHLFGSEKIKKCFLSYWGEPNKSLTKMRFEMEKTWNTKLRITTWLSNAEKWDHPPRPGPTNLKTNKRYDVPL